jgi:4-hydroxy-3-methylbut-2-enyl diphosphate reductase
MISLRVRTNFSNRRWKRSVPRKVQVRLAKSAGFCWGVRRAVNQLQDIARTRQGPVYTYGPIIHNKQVVDLMEKQGIRTIARPDEARSGTVVVRAHGVRPDEIQSIKDSGAELFDATCPLVTKVHRLVRMHAKRGYATLIVGDAGHAEINGVLGYTEGRGIVVADAEELEKVSVPDRVTVVAQTTLDAPTFKAVVERVKTRCSDVKVFDTICDPTYERQDETLALAQEVEAMVVVGGRHSANTVRLVKLVEEAGTPAIHVESAEELRREDLVPYAKIGVTAGASAPDWLIEQVYERVRDLAGADRKGVLDRLIEGVNLAVDLNLHVALGGAALAGGIGLLMGYGRQPWVMLTSGLFLLSILIWNRLASIGTSGAVDRYRSWFYRHYRFHLLACSGLAGLGMVASAGYLGWEVLLTAIGTWIFSAWCGVQWIPCLWPRRINIRGLRSLPASQDIAMGVAWAAACAVFPVLAGGGEGRLLLFPVGLVGLMVLARSTLAGAQEMTSDPLRSSETMIGLFGRKRAPRVVWKVFGGILAFLTLVIRTWSNSQPLAWGLLGMVGWLAGVAAWSRRGTADAASKRAVWLHDLAIDSPFLIAGLACGIGRFII